MAVRRCRSVLVLIYGRNSFRMHSYEKRPRKFFGMPCYKFIGLKVPWNQGFMAVRRCRSALALVYGRNPFRMRTCKKWPRKFFTIHTYKFIGLKASWNEHLQKTPGGAPHFHLFPFAFCLLRQEAFP